MPKIHIVREPFSIDGKDYAKGQAITDPALIEKLKASHDRHLIPQHHEAGASPPDQAEE